MVVIAPDFLEILPAEILVDVILSLSVTEAIVLLGVNKYISGIVSEFLPKMMKKEAELQFDRFLQSKKLSVNSVREVIQSLTYLAAFSEKYIANENELALKQLKIIMLILQIVNIMLFLSKNNVIQFNYLDRYERVPRPLWHQWLFFMRDEEDYNVAITHSVDEVKYASIRDNVSANFEGFNIPTLLSHQDDAAIRRRWEVIDALYNQMNYCRIDCSPTYFESYSHRFFNKKSAGLLKLFNALDRAIEVVGEVRFAVRQPLGIRL